MSTLAVNTLQAQTGSTVSLASGQTLHAPGHVVQTVNSETASQVSVTSTTFTDTSLTATITPKFSNSKIMIVLNQGVYIYRNGVGDLMGGIRLMRDTTMINQGYSDTNGGGGLNPYFALGTSQAMYFSYWHNMTFIDSPNTTSAVTYKTQGNIRNTANTHTITFQQSSNTTNKSTIVLMEIAQ